MALFKKYVSYTHNQPLPLNIATAPGKPEDDLSPGVARTFVLISSPRFIDKLWEEISPDSCKITRGRSPPL